ncbi:hypothetical protein [Shinella zoogloeoides]
MPYDSNGNASLVPSYKAVSGQTIRVEQHNPPLEDIASMLSQVILRSGVAPMSGNLRMGANRITGLADGIDPQDAATKKQLDDGLSSITTGLDEQIEYIAEKIATKSADYQAVKADNSTSFRFTAAATLSFIQADDSDPDVPGLGANWHCEVWAVGGAVTLDPNGSETINGTATLIVQRGQKATIFCTGSAFFAVITSDALSGPQLQGYIYGLALTTNASDAANDVDIAAGAAASDASPFYLMQLASALTKRIDAAWAVGTNQGGLDTGTVGNNTYYIWLIQRSDTLVTDALFSLSSTAPTMPANYDRKRLLGILSRTGGSNGTPINMVGVRFSTTVALTGLSQIEFAIPAGAKRGRIIFEVLSTNGTTIPLVQLGTAAAYATTGYVGGGTVVSSGAVSFNMSSGIAISNTWTAAYTGTGWVEFVHIGGNKYVVQGNIGFSHAAASGLYAGVITLSDTLTRVRIDVGATAFDAGTAAASWEF